MKNTIIIVLAFMFLFVVGLLVVESRNIGKERHQVNINLEVEDGEPTGFWLRSDGNADVDLTISGNASIALLHDIILHSLTFDKYSGSFNFSDRTVTIIDDITVTYKPQYIAITDNSDNGTFPIFTVPERK